MDKLLFVSLCFNADGFHQATAGILAVAGDIVRVLAPKTMRTMVSVAAAGDFISAVLAGEILNLADEVFAWHSCLYYKRQLEAGA